MMRRGSSLGDSTILYMQGIGYLVSPQAVAATGGDSIYPAGKWIDFSPRHSGVLMEVSRIIGTAYDSRADRSKLSNVTQAFKREQPLHCKFDYDRARDLN